MNANACAKHVFNAPPEPYEPHISLVYGNLPEERKSVIAQNLPEDVKTHFEVKTIYLVRADSPHPKDWHQLGAFRLTAKRLIGNSSGKRPGRQRTLPVKRRTRMYR
jgi:hypothetical protein